jgi:diguanylate cyclase (GGDEF)-like protein
LGGEEFVIALPNTSLEQASRVAERMRQAIQELTVTIPYTNHHCSFTASFGVVTLEHDYDETNHVLISRADKALYQAKNQGRNLVCTG